MTVSCCSLSCRVNASAAFPVLKLNCSTSRALQALWPSIPGDSTMSWTSHVSVNVKKQDFKPGGSITAKKQYIWRVVMFSTAMTQRNLSTNTTRSVRRLDQWLWDENGSGGRVSVMFTWPIASEKPTLQLFKGRHSPSHKRHLGAVHHLPVCWAM